MKKFLYCSVQLRPVPLNIDKNVQKCVSWIKEIFRQNITPHLIVFPETVTTGFSLSSDNKTQKINKIYLELKHKLPKIIQLFSTLAKQYNTNILFPTYEPSNVKNKFYNSVIFITSKGKIEGIYRKIYLFPTEHWSIAGRKISLWKTESVKFGCVICFDGDFPELVREYALSGAEMVIRPSAFLRDYNIWKLTNCSRAYENQIYFCAVNSVGTDYAGKSYFGHSMVIDPYARIVVSTGANEDVLLAEIEPKTGLETSNIMKIDHLAYIKKRGYIYEQLKKCC